MFLWYILWPFGTFYVHSVHFMAIWYILCQFGIFSGYLVCIFFPFWNAAARKIWQPCSRDLSKESRSVEGQQTLDMPILEYGAF
jgi:hypothetical protein